VYFEGSPLTVLGFRNVTAIDDYIELGVHHLRIASPVLADVVRRAIDRDADARVCADTALAELKAHRGVLMVRYPQCKSMKVVGMGAGTPGSQLCSFYDSGMLSQSTPAWRLLKCIRKLLNRRTCGVGQSSLPVKLLD
jgi:hypothetical protein